MKVFLCPQCFYPQSIWKRTCQSCAHVARGSFLRVFLHYCKIFVVGTCLISLSILVYVERTTEHYGLFERCMIAGEVLFSDEEILIQHQKNIRMTHLLKSKEKKLRQLETEMERKLDQKAFLQTLEQNLQNIAEQLDDN